MLLVGHEPCLSSLVSRLVAGRDTFAFRMKKAAIAKLVTTTLERGEAELEWLLPPKAWLAMRTAEAGMGSTQAWPSSGQAQAEARARPGSGSTRPRAGWGPKMVQQMLSIHFESTTDHKFRSQKIKECHGTFVFR